MIEYINTVTNETTSTPLSEVPAHMQAVYFKDGAMVDPCPDADEVVPVRRVVMSRSATGPEMYIREYGDQERLLRETVMVPNQ